MNTLRLPGLVSFAACLAAVHANAQTLPAAPAAQPPADNQIREVVVTAQRRSTSLLKTPVSVTSIDSATLQTRGLTNLASLSTETPGVEFAAQYANAYVTIRGIGNGAVLQGTDPGVAFHLDGVYLGQTGLAGSSFLDVDHIEILKGPQGTLFGRNATGGAVNVISKTPTPGYSAELGAEVGASPLQTHVDGFVNGPLTTNGSVLGRLSFRRDYNDGYASNLAPGAAGRLDGQDGYALRAQLQAHPAEQLTVGLTLDYDFDHDHGQATYLLGAPGVSPSGANITLSPAQVAAADAALLGANPASVVVSNAGAHQGVANQDLRDGAFFGARFNLEWRTDAGALKAIAAFDATRAKTNTDGDGTSLNFTNTEVFEHAHQVYGELLWASRAYGPFDYVAGANIFYQRSSENFTVPISYLDAAVIQPSTLDTTSYAVFAHGDYSVTTKARLFAGVRFTDDAKTITEANNFIDGGVPLTHGASWARVTYEVGGSYQVTAAVNAYAKYSTGFKGGGFSAGSLAAPFRPETDSAVEIGLKGLYLERRLEADLAAYHMDYNDLQVNQVRGASSVVANAAQARINGVEAQVIALPTPRLRLELMATYLDARFVNFFSIDSARPSLGMLNLAGNYLPNAPQSSVSAGAYYRLPVDLAGELTLGGRYYWKDRAYFSEFNLPVSSQAAVGRGDLSLIYVSADRRWQAEIFARNITDATVLNRVQVVSSLLNSAALGALDPGREIGVSLRRRF